tara:strand:- start:235 stop:555 length:321 start_codon:yes stop_codon:yes gene_type:complete
MYEKAYSPNYMISVEEGSTKLRNITLLALIGECGYLRNYTPEEVNRIKTIEVEWDYDGDEIDICGFSIDGKRIRVYNDLPQNRLWSDNDEKLVSSLLMWGELEDEL